MSIFKYLKRILNIEKLGKPIIVFNEYSNNDNTKRTGQEACYQNNNTKINTYFLKKILFL